MDMAPREDLGIDSGIDHGYDESKETNNQGNDNKETDKDQGVEEIQESDPDHDPGDFIDEPVGSMCMSYVFLCCALVSNSPHVSFRVECSPLHETCSHETCSHSIIVCRALGALQRRHCVPGYQGQDASWPPPLGTPTANAGRLGSRDGAAGFS